MGNDPDDCRDDDNWKMMNFHHADLGSPFDSNASQTFFLFSLYACSLRLQDLKRSKARKRKKGEIHFLFALML